MAASDRDVVVHLGSTFIWFLISPNSLLLVAIPAGCIRGSDEIVQQLPLVPKTIFPVIILPGHSGTLRNIMKVLLPESPSSYWPSSPPSCL